MCGSDKAVVLISHSDVNNTILNGCMFRVENIYMNQKEKLDKKVFSCEYAHGL